MSVGDIRQRICSVVAMHRFSGRQYRSGIQNMQIIIIARPRAEGGYEIIAGHRRRHACEAVGLETMPMFIRNYTDDEATIIMVDSNIQREDILPSEKAKAYRMKYDAMKHQGKKGVGNSLDEVGEAQERVARLFRGISIFQDYLTNC